MASPNTISFADLRWNLPLFEDLFLSMQAQNVMLVDLYLQDMEGGLMRRYMEIERTPFPETLIVSALSQMWIFALYELLRTWRQRVRDLKQEAQKPPEPPDPAPPPNLSDLTVIFRQDQLERVRTDAAFVAELDHAYERVEPLFRRVEALRMNLAKHEVPKMRGVPALAPGYGRIDVMSGSIQWQVDLRENVVDLVSRRDLADYLRQMVIARPDADEVRKAKKKLKAKVQKAAKRSQKKRDDR
ncbi:MAG: hypothetical protein ACRD4R_05675 [Candidatus Acidiferrales bacterium]